MSTTHSQGLETERPAGKDGIRPGLKVFVNYRHADTGWAAWALYFKLESQFGAENIFFDNGTLQPGDEWFEEIKSRVAEADIFLALIGESWEDRLSSIIWSGGDDYVATEIELALLRKSDVSLIPVLVDEAKPPRAAALPIVMKALPSKQVWPLRQEHAREDIAHLIGRLLKLQDRLTGHGIE